MAPWDINCWLVIKHYEPPPPLLDFAHTHIFTHKVIITFVKIMRGLVSNVNTALMVVMRTLTLTMSVFVLCEQRGNTLNWQLPL